MQHEGRGFQAVEGRLDGVEVLRALYLIVSQRVVYEL